MFLHIRDFINNLTSFERSQYYWPSEVNLIFFRESSTLCPSPYYQNPSLLDVILHPFKSSYPAAHADKVIKLNEKQSKDLRSSLDVRALYIDECDIREVNGNYSMRPSSCVQLRNILREYITP